MKKFVTILLTLSLAACMVVMAAACGNNDNPPAPDDNKSEYDFIDYAEKVYLNTEKYPELEDQGLFVLGYDEGKGVFDVRASSAEGAAMVDPKKPTVILVHGWLGSDFKEDIGYAPQKIKPFLHYKMDNIPGYEGKEITEALIGAGYNVMMFEYNRFAVHDIVSNEAWIYIGGTEKYPYVYMSDYDEGGGEAFCKGATYRDNDICAYSLSQFFAAEYIRMVKAVGDDFGTAETRIAGHSLGGIMSTVSTNLIYELAKAGQIKTNQVPSRLALLDTYIGFLKDDEMYETETVKWSGESFVSGSSSDTYLSYIDNMAEGGIAIETYLAMNGIVPAMSRFSASSEYVMNGLAEAGMLKAYRLLEVAAGVVCGKWPTGGGNWGIDSHVEICKYYLGSMLTGAKTADGKAALSGKLETSEVKALMGKTFKTTGGIETSNYGNFVLTECDRFDYNKTK